MNDPIKDAVLKDVAERPGSCLPDIYYRLTAAHGVTNAEVLHVLWNLCDAKLIVHAYYKGWHRWYLERRLNAPTNLRVHEKRHDSVYNQQTCGGGML
jgi:hypothetical protein